MTSAISSRKHRIPFLKFFAFRLKERWTLLLGVALIFFFILPIPLLMSFSDIRQSSVNNPTQLEMLYRENALEWAKGIGMMLIPITVILGMLIVCRSFRYLQNRIATDFYHGIPVSRSRLFSSLLLESALILYVPLLVMLGLSFVICASYGTVGSQLCSIFFSLLHNLLLFSLITFSLTFFICSFSGSGIVGFLLTNAAIYYLPLLYTAYITFTASLGSPSWYDSSVAVDWYLDGTLLGHLSPGIRYFQIAAEEGSRLSLAESIIYLVLSVGFLVGAYFLCKIRRSERSGQPIVFRPLRDVIVFLFVVPATMLGGVFFSSIMTGNRAWAIFGMISAGLLTFMIANAILRSNAREMFANIKAFGIFAAVFAVFSVLVISGLLGVGKKIPPAESIQKVEFSLPYTTRIPDDFAVYVEEPDAVAYLRGLYDDSSLSDGIHTCDLVFYPKFGIPLARAFYRPITSFDVLLSAYDSDSFKEQYTAYREESYRPLERNSCYVVGEVMVPDQEGFAVPDFDDNGRRKLNPEQTERLVAAMKKDEEGVGVEYLSATAIAKIRLVPEESGNSYGSHSVTFLLTSKTPETLKVLCEFGYLDFTFDEYLENYLNVVSSIKVYGWEELVVTDKEKIREILLSVNNLSTDYDYDQVFTDPRYGVDIFFKGPDGNDDPESENYGKVRTWINTHFTIGKVPAFVSEACGEGK